MDIQTLTTAIKVHARHLGFDYCRITPIEKAPHADFLVGWLARRRAGEMTYLERNVDKRCEPHRLAEARMPAFRSNIVLAANHFQFPLSATYRDDPSRGIIASYAWADDYHEIVRPLLHELDSFIRGLTDRTTRGKCLVDTGPVLERDWAHRAGIGFSGKNCCTIHPRSGSWLFLATILIPEKLVYDRPHPTWETHIQAGAVLNGLHPAHNYGSWEIPLGEDGTHTAQGTCGRCVRCLDACPTQAFIGPYHLDPQRCISYWTIEAKQPVPRPLRPLFGNRIFGCDICQEVCPWNRKLDVRQPLLAALQAKVDQIALPLLEGFASSTPYWISGEAFNARFRHTPIHRARRGGMLRNVCIALGNWADPAGVAPLRMALADPDPLVRGHAAWALGCVLVQHRHPETQHLLSNRLGQEEDEWVREEISVALHG